MRILSVSLCFFILSCEKAPFLITDCPYSFTFPDTGGSENISFSCNREWKVSSSDSWVHVSPSSGSASEGTITVSLTCDANLTEDYRKTEVIIKADEISKTIYITQDIPNLLVPCNEYNVSSESQSLEIDIKSNVKVKVESEVNWISYVETKGFSSSSIVLLIQANDSFEQRSGIVNIIAGKNTIPVKINQAVNYGITVTPNSIAISREEQTFSIKVKANVDYSVDISSNGIGWLSFVQTKAATEHELVFKSASNSSFNSREASVVLRQKNGDINTVINVVQTGEEAILINADYGYDYLYFDGLYYTITSTDDCTASVSSWGKESSEEVRIPSYISYKGKQLKVNNIGHAAFKGMDYLHKLIVPWTISSITQEAFVGCTGLKDIIFEDSDEELELSFQKYESNPGYFGAGKGLFYDCPLETIELGRNILYNDYEDSAAKYGYSPFYNKTSLVSFICSDHVTRIGNYLLSGSTSLTNLVFSSKIQEIGIHAFAGSGIIEVQLPESLNQIGANAFNSSLIEKIVLPKSLKELPSGSFNNCYRLKEIHIYGLEKILSQAFSGCSKIRNIYCYVNNPPTFVLQSAGVIVSFDTSVFTEGTLYVPSDCVESYQSSEEWKKFWSIKPLP